MKPLLYTFRRCPYAIRARLAIKVSGVDVEMREVDLRDKPQAMLACSPKGTAPVLQFADGAVIDESLDIMRWALAINDPEAWVCDDAQWSAAACSLIQQNDGVFKRDLDRYKYAVRYPGHPAEYYRTQAEIFLRELTARLTERDYLMGERSSLPDAAIFPFVRQFSQVDKDWFYAAHAGPLVGWLDRLLRTSLFVEVMQK